MPYESTTDLPKSVRNNLPNHAQVIYKEAFNHAWKEYKNPEDRRDNASQEETAHKVAWSAVEKKYCKDKNGKWIEHSDLCDSKKN